jgi:transcription initiation factor TFIIIB Brf1 subunit/transcription initiation factor TFIIB
MGIDSERLGEACLNLYNESIKSKTKTLKAEIIYKVCIDHGFTVSKDLICSILDVKTAKLKNETTIINTTLSTRIRPLAKAIIGSCGLKVSKVMAGIMKMENIMLRTKETWMMYISKKPSKIDPVLLYMSCVQNDVHIKKEEFVKYSNISIVTFRHHFKMLEKIFKV